MTWYQDFAECDYLPLANTSRLKAIGWLEDGQPFERGPVSARDLQCLFKLAVKPWQPSLFLGGHDCSLCQSGDGPDTFRLLGRTVVIGSSNLLVPDAVQRCVYVAPTMILHYVEVHGYRPPTQFLQAARKCPAMGSSAYLLAIRAAGGDSWACQLPVAPL